DALFEIVLLSALSLYRSHQYSARRSFPTRRSSDLRSFRGNKQVYVPKIYRTYSNDELLCMEFIEGVKINDTQGLAAFNLTPKSRSEEHTSELQSRENLVCRLLLEQQHQTVVVDREG